MPAFTYEQYSDAQGHFTYDGAALKLVKRPAHLARVYKDAAREDARAKVLVRELEHWFHQAGVIVADTTTRPGGGRTVVEGTRDGVQIRVIVEKDGSIVTGFPINTPRNP